MTFALSWIDHDQEARNRMERILAMFEERDTRDELGLGAIRDSFSDLLFPGTSTIQTRLRYFLVVAWVYQRLEKERVPSREINQRARDLELDIGEHLVRNGEEEGVFGRRAGRRLKRLPSSVYWAGLGTWKLFLFEAAQFRYHRSLDAIYQQRGLAEKRGNQPGFGADPSTTWDPGLPDPPPGFPKDITLTLTAEEAGYLQERVKYAAPDSLLGHLFLHAQPVDCRFPWEHPDYADFTEAHKAVLKHAHLFSEVMYGAALLYNLLLSRDAQREEGIELYTKRLQHWSEELDRTALDNWSLDELWATIHGQGHTITCGARGFVTGWVQHVKSGDLDSPAVALSNNRVGPARLVRRREELLKGPRSRFTNQRALDQWSGESGLGQMNYRWGVVRSHLRDLSAALGGS